MINFLLRHGANVNAKTKLNYTPLHMGAQQGHVLVVKVLLQYKANPDDLTSVCFLTRIVFETFVNLGFIELYN